MGGGRGGGGGASFLVKTIDATAKVEVPVEVPEAVVKEVTDKEGGLN